MLSALGSVSRLCREAYEAYDQSRRCVESLMIFWVVSGEDLPMVVAGCVGFKRWIRPRGMIDALGGPFAFASCIWNTVNIISMLNIIVCREAFR